MPTQFAVLSALSPRHAQKVRAGRGQPNSKCSTGQREARAPSAIWSESELRFESCACGSFIQVTKREERARREREWMEMDGWRKDAAPAVSHGHTDSLTQPCDSCQMLVRQPDSCPTHEPGCTPVGSLTHTHTPARPTVLPSFRTLDPVVVRVAVDVHGVVRDLGFRPHTRRARAWSEPRREREGEGGAERVSFSRGKREARQGEAEGGRGRGRSRRNKGQGGVREVEARGGERGAWESERGRTQEP